MSDVKQLYSAAETLELLREIVAEFGDDHVNWNEDGEMLCSYADDNGEPSCIAGQALYRADPVAFDRVRQWEQAHGSAMFSIIPTQMGVDLPFTPLAVMALRRAQKVQDEGEDWGMALHRAFVYVTDYVTTYPDKEMS